jgi:hypothetical protein
MIRSLAFVALLVMLSLRFVDGAAHQQAHQHEHLPGSDAVIAMDVTQDCGDAFHAAAHCASMMADHAHRTSSFIVASRPVSAAGVAPEREQIEDGRTLSPPIRPPLA